MTSTDFEYQILIILKKVIVKAGDTIFVSMFQFLPDEVILRKVDRTHFPFSQNLFWDSALDLIDMETHKNYIIERVLTRGLLADYYYLFKIYHREEIIAAIKKSKIFDAKLAHFCSNYFDIPISEINVSKYYS